jgi:predicted HAD superfamily Cof-like phosphohydrolase
MLDLEELREHVATCQAHEDRVTCTCGAVERHLSEAGTSWAKHLVPREDFQREAAASLRTKALWYADWVEGGDPNYVEDLYQVAYELGRRAGSNFEKVRAFHEHFQLPVAASPQQLAQDMNLTAQAGVIVLLRQTERVIQQKRKDGDVQWGRVQMMIEELREYCEAVQSGDLAAQADSLVDLDYFVAGTAVMSGFPHDRVFDAVHEANMKKVLVSSADESRRLNKLDVKKPEGWTPPDVAGILEVAKGTA